jgi:hypothetical protein
MGDCMTIGAIQANPAGEYTGGHGWAPTLVLAGWELADAILFWRILSNYIDKIH